jgi:ElaB/YqjD/DUF883 family membrane-anchored ribosome-binding protein
MKPQAIPDEVESVQKNLKQAGETIAHATTDAYHTACSKTEDWVSCLSDNIRKNPLPAVAGALALGITVGALLMSGRRQPVLSEETFSDAGDSLVKSLTGLRDHLKFW